MAMYDPAHVSRTMGAEDVRSPRRRIRLQQPFRRAQGADETAPVGLGQMRQEARDLLAGAFRSGARRPLARSPSGRGGPGGRRSPTAPAREVVFLEPLPVRLRWRDPVPDRQRAPSRSGPSRLASSYRTRASVRKTAVEEAFLQDAEAARVESGEAARTASTGSAFSGIGMGTPGGTPSWMPIVDGVN